jgi:hydroxymethylglutaryl-CoA lyase
MSKIEIVEMAMRDGLQNEKQVITIDQKMELADRLISAGVKRLEVGAFVRKDKIPQMDGSFEVASALVKKYKNIRFSALVPNEQGMNLAMKAGLKEIAIFASSTESFSRHNINCSIEESFQRFEPVMKLAKKNKIKVRGYLSVCFGCPYEGSVDPNKVVKLAQRLFKMGCHEISIGDTIGVASPADVENLFKKLKKVIPVKNLAGHFHDTRGTALANVFAAYRMGIKVFDTSLGGLGGCPYAPGSSGNVATEDVIYMFHKMKVSTNFHEDLFIANNHWMEKVIHHSLPSKVSKAGLPKI